MLEHISVALFDASNAFFETLLAVFLTSYRRRHPGVEVHLIEDGGARLAGRLERGDAHLGLMAAGDPRMGHRLLSPIYVLVVLSPRDRLSRRAVLDGSSQDGSDHSPTGP